MQVLYSVRIPSVNNHKKHLFQDAILLTISIFFAVLIAKTGLAEKFVLYFDNLWWLGIIIAGIFFTSIFTTASSIVLLGTFAQDTNLLILTILGGLGAMFGDYVIFRFIKDRVSEDFEYLISVSKQDRLSAIIKTQLFKFFAPFLGALIIVSPLPDEFGLAMLSISKIKNRVFLPLTFFLNSLGVFIVAWVAKSILGV